MNLALINGDDAESALSRCCGAKRWVAGMLELRPFESVDSVLRAAEHVWAGMEPDDIQEAFEHHPRIGASLESLREKFGVTANWAAGEQASVSDADETTIRALQAGNIAYEQRYGYIFIVCASGKSANEMLALLEGRMHHDPIDELRIAATEQAKITRLRLEKL